MRQSAYIFCETIYTVTGIMVYYKSNIAFTWTLGDSDHGPVVCEAVWQVKSNIRRIFYYYCIYKNIMKLISILINLIIVGIITVKFFHVLLTVNSAKVDLQIWFKRAPKICRGRLGCTRIVWARGRANLAVCTLFNHMFVGSARYKLNYV